MLRIAFACLIATLLNVQPSLADGEMTVQQVQFRGGPGGQCPDGYAFNFDNGRCYPNGYAPPGVYARGYDRPYQRPYGWCPDGYNFNYSNNRCYRGNRMPPGTYAR